MNEFDELLNRFRAPAPPEAVPEPAGETKSDDADAAAPGEQGESVATPEATQEAPAASEEAPAASEAADEPLQAQQLRAFQERISERLGQAGAARQTKLGVQAGGRHWLVELSEAGEIVAVPANFAVVPLTHSWLRGLVNLRGSLYAVTDLADFLGEPPSVVGRESRLLVFASRLNLNAAVLVDRMLGLQDMAGLNMISDPDGADAAEWVDSQDRHWYELSLQQLAVDERFLVAAR